MWSESRRLSKTRKMDVGGDDGDSDVVGISWR